VTQPKRRKKKTGAERWPPRVVIENIRPQVEGGRYPVKRTVGEKVVVTADIHGDGHDALGAVVRYRAKSDKDWKEVPMEFVLNDLWRGVFPVSTLEPYEYTVQAWVDHFQSWHQAFTKKVQAGQDVRVDILVGAKLVEEARARATDKSEAKRLAEWARALADDSAPDPSDRIRKALDDELALLMDKHPDRSNAAGYDKTLEIVVDREKARFSTWYEMFPRSCSPEPDRHGTFKDCLERLPYIAAMEFDVLYLTPIHPIGRTNRKGKNNNPVAGPEDVGSPWAIGAAEGGHKAIHPQLGTLEDFRQLVTRAKDYGLEVALDLAFQCTPDHPYVKEHPEWFRLRPDGSIQFAENPPKKYEDIFPLEFENPNWRGLWEELKSVVLYWLEQGIRLFRVDNPHTKPYAFWEWLIGEVRRDYPDVIFLCEAFTRPKVMYRLGKLGFNQSYTYFAWRNTKWELTNYFTELTQTEVREFFRPHLWPNTPDILPEHLQIGGRPMFISRLVLAATLSAGYGIYGPAFELCVNAPLAPGKEEYLDSEKYELKQWDLKRPESLKNIITRVNRARRENAALQSNESLRFLPVDNDQLIAYYKRTADFSNIILTVVNLDPFNTQAGWIDLPLEDMGLDPQHAFQVHDLLSDARYFWQGARNYVELDPHVLPAHLFRLRRRLRSERDFDYFM
jgi:starch synthase (maltosyl-transferring)